MLSACSPATSTDTPRVSSTTATTELTVDGRPVVGVPAVLDAAEVASQDYNLEDARCYLLTFDGAELNPILRCGPALPQMKTALGPWMTYSLDLEDEGAELRLKRGRDHGSGYSLLEGEILSRPDGAQPPPIDEISVPAPTGQAWVTVWHALDPWFHYCMAESDVLAFSPDFTFDGKERDDLDWDEPVEMVQLERYSLTEFSDAPAADELRRIEEACTDSIARRAGASFGVVRE